MVRLKYKDAKNDILRRYREDSFRVNLVQQYSDKENIVKDIRLFWGKSLRTISYN
ncbi:MAG: hypothetical protein K9H84_04925 [Bacteroidales bacterium]|nr:hypothetical protein [Bacteroidales bacterium]